MISVGKYLIMVEEPSNNLNNSVFRVIYKLHEFFCIGVLFNEDTFYFVKDQIKLILA